MYLRFFQLIFFAMHFFIFPLSAANMCKVDWLTQWRNMPDGTTFAKPYNIAFSRGFDGTTTGSWSFTKDGHTVSGISQCGSSNSLLGSSGDWTNEYIGIDAAVNTNNKHCWCRMTAPATGLSWVFDRSPVSYRNCTESCPSHCAHCAQGGTPGLCRRSALFAI